MPHVRSLLLISLTLLLGGCHADKPTPTSAAQSITLMHSGKVHPQVWFALSGNQRHLTAQTKLTGMYVIHRQRATTYMLSTTHPYSLNQIPDDTTQQLIAWGKRQDYLTYNEGIHAQQAYWATKSHHLKQQLRQSTTDSLQQELRLAQVIHDNPQRYTAPAHYSLTATVMIDRHHRVTGEAFSLQAFPVMTVQYGDATLITANPQLLSNRVYTHLIGPISLDGHPYVGYRAITDGVSHWLVTRVPNQRYRIRFDNRPTTGVRAISSRSRLVD